MSHFKYNIQRNSNTDKQAIILINEIEGTAYQTYELLLPELLKRDRSKILWAGIQIAHWKNTIGKNSTFKELVRRFDQYCKEADKLKI